MPRQTVARDKDDAFYPYLADVLRNRLKTLDPSVKNSI